MATGTGTKDDPIRLESGEGIRGGKVVKLKEWERQQRLEEGREFDRKRLEATRPGVTRRQIIVGPQGEQLGLVQERGETEVDITEFTPQGERITETVRGIPQFVDQEQQRVVGKKFPKVVTISETELSQRQKEATTKSQLKRISDIETQLASRLVRQEKRGELEQELNRLRGETQIQEGLVNLPPEPKRAKLMSVTKKQSIAKKSFDQLNNYIGAFVSGQLEIERSIREYPGSLREKRYNEERAKLEKKYKSGNFLVDLRNAREYQEEVEKLIDKYDVPATGSISPFATLGRAKTVTVTRRVPQAIKALREGRGVTNAFRTLRGTTTGGVLERLAVGTGRTFAVGQTVEGVGRVTATKDQKAVLKKLLDKNIDPNNVLQDVNAAERIAVLGAEDPAKLGPLQLSSGINLGFTTLSTRGLAYDLPGGTLIPFKGSSEARKSVIDKYASDAGLSSTEKKNLQSWINRMRKTRATREIAEQLSIEATSESAGRFAMRRGFLKKAGQKVEGGLFGAGFKTAAPRLITPGIYEGAAGEAFQRFSRDMDQSLSATLTAGGIGGVISPLAGGTVAGFAAKGAKKSRAVTSTVLNIVDPLEWFGDRFQDISESLNRRITRRSFLEPGFISSKVKGATVTTFGVSTPTKGGKGMVPNLAEEQEKQQRMIKKRQDEFNKNINKRLNPTQTPQTVYTFEDIIGESEKVPSTTKQPEPQETINKIQEEQRQIQERIQQQQNAFTTNQVFTFTQVPTTTPFPRLPAPMPILIPPGAGGSGRGGKGSKKYYNELQIALNTLFGRRVYKQKKPRKKKNAKKKQKR